MRGALIAVVIAMVSLPAQASTSCMTMSEARAHLGAVHLYWHGTDHCWDATPGRHGLVKRAKTKEPRQAERDAAKEEKPSRWAHEPRWREAMSKMLPEDALPMQTPASPAAGSERGETPQPRMNWRDRWVDVAPRVPPVADGSGKPSLASDLTADAGPGVEPMVTPTRVMLAFLAVLLTLAVIEILFRTTIHDWRE